jgi:hypothetical protein
MGTLWLRDIPMNRNKSYWKDNFTYIKITFIAHYIGQKIHRFDEVTTSGT